MKRNVITIAADKHMFPAAAFVAARLASLNPPEDVDIAILSDSEDDLEKARQFGVPAHLIHQKLPVELDGKPTDRITVATFFRLFVPDYVDKSVARIIHLDADTYPENERIFELFDLDMGDLAVAAAHDFRLIYAADEPYVRSELAKARVTADDYLNSGLLLIDRAKFVQKKIGHRAFKIVVSEYLRNDLVLNRVLAGKWIRLSPAMNAPADLLDVLTSSGYQPVLTHFIGIAKPWHGPRFASSHRARKEIEAYLLKSPWRSFLSQHYSFQAAWDTLQAKRGGPTYAAPPTVKQMDIAHKTRVDDLRAYLKNEKFADVQAGITKVTPPSQKASANT